MADQKFDFIVEQICCANAQRNEQIEKYRYGSRLSKFLNHFNSMKTSAERPTVISIKELRTCMDESGTTMTPLQQLFQLAKCGNYAPALMDCQAFSYTGEESKFGEKNPFYIAQIYDHLKVENIKSHFFRFYDIFTENPPDAGCAVLCTLYCLKNDLGISDQTKKFFVESYHFPMGGEHKLKISQFLMSEYLDRKRKVFADSESIPVIRVGDFNLFKDDSTFSSTYDNLTKDYIDVSTPNLQDEFGGKIYGTFFPFPHDNPPVKIAKPNENDPNTSVLDYFFLKKNCGVTLTKCIAITSTNNPENPSEVMTYDTTTIPLSDHIPLLGFFKFI